jgi:hypothetical protein
MNYWRKTMTATNQHYVARNVQAQQEIDIMFSLVKGPKTPAELCQEFGLPNNRIRYLLRGLREAECVGKITGTHAVELLSPF